MAHKPSASIVVAITLGAFAILLCGAVLLMTRYYRAVTEQKQQDPAARAGGPFAQRIEALTRQQHFVTQSGGDDRAWMPEGGLWNQTDPGLYLDIVSDKPLFSSLDKYDAADGYPAFSAPLDPTEILTQQKSSGGETITKLKSKTAGSHLGELLADGPADKGGRHYRVYSSALRFVAAADLEKEKLGEYRRLFEPVPPP